MRPQLDAIVAVVVGYTDWVVDAVSVRLVGGDALRIAEAVRRQRIETSASDTFVEQLLGIRVGEEQVARGKSFAQGVVDRAGDHGLRAAARTAGRAPHAGRGRCPRSVARPHRGIARPHLVTLRLKRDLVTHVLDIENVGDQIAVRDAG